ncbi:MAG: type 1 glutamine amidotransferase [Candidatus Omnitrophica bacterium]|nr:type 1 glutamine amidotransferase [Candidatus Omnitrophota bacterium]
MIVIIKHAQIEGPGLLGNFFRNTFFETRVVELWRKEKLPEVSACQAIISLGGPMNVYETDKYPFLSEEEDFLKEALLQRIPFLGICLGAQLLAKVCGASVTRAACEEIGWYRVAITEDALGDALLGKFCGDIEVFQWHRDTFTLAPGAILLAYGKTCKNQAFRIGECAWGLQFHPEMTQEMLKNWLNDCPAGVDKERILVEYNHKGNEYLKQANQIFLNFERAIGECLVTRK